MPNQRAYIDKPKDMTVHALKAVKEIDRQRPNFPGEHLMVFAAGAYLLTTAGRRRSMVGRLATSLIGSALIARAASGTGGIAKVAKVLDKRKF